MSNTGQFCACALLLAICFGGTEATAQSSPLSTELENHIARIEERVIDWRRDFHAHPELGNRETRTSEIVAAHLRSLGLDVTTGIAHTGVVGILRGGRPGPVVALRADMDALPITERGDLPFASTETTIYNGAEVGVMHACGHDTHTAILMGVAEVLAGIRTNLPGTVKFIFQPAEEGAPAGEDGGAELMVAEGVLTNPNVDAAFALHIDAQMEVGKIGYKAGGTYASSDDFRMIVRGVQSHGAYPWRSVDPILTASQIVSGLQTIVSRNVPLLLSPAIITVGSIHGGVRSNIIPEEVELTGTVRSLHPDVRALMLERIPIVATNIAESMGATVEIDLPYTTSNPVTYNNEALTARMGPVLAAVAGDGQAFVKMPKTAAEDFSYISREVPGFYYGLGGRPVDVPVEESASHHSPDFFIDESALVLGVRSMAAVAIAFLEGE